MSKKILIRDWDDYNKRDEELILWYSKIIESKKKEDEQLLQVLKSEYDAEDTMSDEEFLKLILGVFRDTYKSINKAIEKLEILVNKPLNPSQKKKLIDYFMGNPEKIKKVSSFIKFFEANNLLNSLSFVSLLNLFSLNLSEKKLENLIKMADTKWEWSEMDMEVNNILENVDDSATFSDSITNKVIKLKQIELNYDYNHIESYGAIDFEPRNYILLKDIKITEQLINKIKTLIEAGIFLSTADILSMSNLKIDETILDKLNILKEIAYISFEDLPKVQKLTTDDIKILIYINQIRWKKIDYINWLDFVLKLKKSEIDKIFWDIRKLWLNDITSYECFEIFYNIPEEVLQYCIKNNIRDTEDVKKVKVMYSLSRKDHMRDYILRKQGFLEENKTLSEEKYCEYFWWKWKFGKHEINQWNIWLCYLYSCLEILKKMNWFSEFIQSNFIEKDDGWLIRLPFNVWSWIKVNKDEIDRTYKVNKNRWKIRKMDINSRSEYLWFKILEIAYIKNKLISKSWSKELWIKKGDWKEDNPLDILISWENLENVEWGNSILALQELLSKENIVGWCIGWYNYMWSILKRLKELSAPKTILNIEEAKVKEKDNRIDALFNLHKTWFISIELSSSPNFSPLWEWMKKIEWKKTYFLVSGIEVVDKFWQKLSQEKLNNIRDLEIDEWWNINVKFFTSHAYSVEKCYVDKYWKKKVRVVNPHHTWIKFDMSLEKCKILFNWTFWVINIDKLFTQHSNNSALST